MPIIKKKIEQIFGEEMLYDTKSILLSTIRVPKNLLYLTDRLPKPNYESEKERRRLEEEARRKTHDIHQSMLPEINQSPSSLSKH